MSVNMQANQRMAQANAHRNPVQPDAINWTTQRDTLINKWTAAKAALDAAKESEMELRKQVSEICFPNPVKGTQRYELGNGYSLKLVHKLNYKLGDKDKIDKDGVKVPINEQVEQIQAAIEKCGNEGAFLVDRLIKTQYDLSISEYNKLDSSSQIKKLIDQILITSDASPVLEFESPSEK